MVCGVVFLVGLVRRGLVDLGLVAVARRIGSVVGLAVGGVALRLGVSVRVLGGILVGLAVSVVLVRLAVGVVLVGLAVSVLIGLGVTLLVGLVRVGLVLGGLGVGAVVLG